MQDLNPTEALPQGHKQGSRVTICMRFMSDCSPGFVWKIWGSRGRSIIKLQKGHCCQKGWAQRARSDDSLLGNERWEGRGWRGFQAASPRNWLEGTILAALRRWEQARGRRGNNTGSLRRRKWCFETWWFLQDENSERKTGFFFSLSDN